MGANDKPVDYCYQAAVLQEFDGPPVRSFRTPWLRCDRGLFCVDIAVIGPISKQAEGYLPLTRSEADRVLEAITDTVKALQEKLR